MVTAHFSDGSTDHGDLLVGADGVGSRVARQCAGTATSAPVGICGIAGRVPLDQHHQAHIPALLRRGPALAFAPGGVGMFLSVHDAVTAPAIDPNACTQIAPEASHSELVWGLIATDRQYPARTRYLDGAGILDVALGLLAGWSSSVRVLVGDSDPHTVAFFAFHAADPDADLTPRPAGTVTCVGDAIHAMPPPEAAVPRPPSATPTCSSPIWHRCAPPTRRSR